MADRFVDRTRGSQWQSALPTGSKRLSALPTGEIAEKTQFAD
ncbi:MAG: hypothetical protein PUK86_06390 [bacterium]|nr:hypothetical protein [bacterium]